MTIQDLKTLFSQMTDRPSKKQSRRNLRGQRVERVERVNTQSALLHVSRRSNAGYTLDDADELAVKLLQLKSGDQKLDTWTKQARKAGPKKLALSRLHRG